MKLRVHWMVALAGIAVASLIALALLWKPGDPATGHRLRPDDAGVVARGERVYRNHCATCHGARLEGQPNWREFGADGRLPAPPHDASGHTWHHPDDVLFKLTKYGLARMTGAKNANSAMPVYEGVLSDDDIVAVLSWIKAQWPAELRQRHDQINLQTQR